MVDVTEILQHWYAGRPKVEVARSLGVDAKTVRRYVAPAEAAGMAPGGPPVSEEQWRALARQWFPQIAGTGIRQVSWREIAVHHDRIARARPGGLPSPQGAARPMTPVTGTTNDPQH